MNILLLCFGLLGVAAAAPNSWPYRDSLHPYYYGYPGQTPYVYRASLEDDEEPVERSRQDSGASVASLIQNAAAKQQEAIDNYGSEKVVSVVETGSVAPVPQDARPTESSAPTPVKVGAPSSSSSTQAAAPSAPNVVKPGVVNPPAFPPLKKRPPPQPTKKPAEEEEEDEDDDDEESAEDDESPEDDDEEEVDAERRRNEPINVVPATVDVPENGTSLESGEVPVNANVTQPAAPASESTVAEEDENNETVPITEVQVGPDQEDDMSDEASLEGVEAFVPGYITDQGEVLVPVDTVTGDQPISIVPDPYTPPSRGVPLNYFGYNAANLHHPSSVTPGRLYRQDEFGGSDDDDSESQEDRDEDEEEEEADEAEKVEEVPEKVEVEKKKKNRPPLGLIPATSPTNEDDELETALRYRSELQQQLDQSFPPSRSPTLYPVTFKIGSGYLTGPFERPVASSEVFQYVDPVLLYRQRPHQQVSSSVVPGNVFYSAVQQNRRPVTSPNHLPVHVSLSVPTDLVHQALRRTQGSLTQQSQRPVYSPALHPYYNRPYDNQPPQYIPRQTLHNPGEKLKIKSSYELLVEPHSKGDRVRNKKRPNKKRVSNKKTSQANKRRPVTVIARPQVTPYRPVRPGSGAQPSVLYRPVYNVQPLQRVPARVSVGPGYRQPPHLSSAYNEFIKGLAAGYYGNRRPGPGHRPTPVIQQDEPVVHMQSGLGVAPSMPLRTPKTRREAKKVKKNKKVTDPLQILKKINRKA